MNTVYLQPFKSYEEDRPPQFEYQSSDTYLEPDDEYVISMRNGLVLSHYGDDEWDLSPYGADNVKIPFTTIPVDKLRREAKRLLYLYMTHGSGKGKTLPSSGAVYAKYNSFIKPLAEYIHHTEGFYSFNDILSHPKSLRIFIISYTKDALHRATSIQTILFTLNIISNKRSGFDYIYNKQNIKILSILNRKYTENSKQTILIPVAIYAAAAKERWKHIEFIEKHVKKLATFINDLAACRGFGAASSSNLTPEERKQYVTWDDAVRKHSLKHLFQKYNVMGIQNFLSFLTSIQITCRHLIHQYTGMRDNECRSLAQDCWQDKNEEMPSRVHGIEKKIHGVPTKQVWITHDVLKRVINLLNIIGEPMRVKICPKLKHSPLLIKVSLLKSELKADFYDAVKVSKITQSESELPIDTKYITLSKEYITEMSLVDDRDWSEHAWVKVGATWKFSTHQYRRALAVYALGSGLVSLHAIKEQFGHLMSIMTAYYGNGYKSARKLDGAIDEQGHIARYMLSIKTDMKFYSYRNNILLSKTPLWGANGIHLEKHIVARTSKDREIVMRKSEKYKQNFKKGLLDYQDTAMGGCTNSSCAKFLLPDFFISCKGCEHAIHQLEKVEKLAEKQRQVTMKWADIHPDGIDHRTAVKLWEEINNFADILRRKEDKEKE